MTRWRTAAAAVVTLAGLFGCDGGEDLPLVGTSWRATNIAGHPALAETTVTFGLSAENRLDGTAGCNHYFGGATAESGRIAIRVGGWTRAGCHPVSIMHQENRYLATLMSATSYQIRGDKLRLESAATPPVTIDFISR